HRSVTIDETRGFDPLYTAELQMSELSSSMYSRLLRFEDGRLSADLAESWEADATARRYRFTLRKGVTFADGVGFNAGHVKAHFERLLAPASAAPDAVLFKDISGAPAYLSGEARSISGIEVLDEHTIEFRLDEPRAFFLRMLA